jgi:TonB family protein
MMSRTEAWRSWEGRLVDGKYPLRQWLGGSDHSAVFVTERPDQPSQKAAIKLTDAALIDLDRELAWLREATKLSHPHLLSTFDAGSCRLDGTTVMYALMEYAEEDLSQILPQRPLSPEEVSQMLPPLLDALSYLHGKGLVHTRIRPSNVLASADQLKLSTDHVMAAGQPRSARRPVGVYDAPETATGIVTKAGDLWSLGVTIVVALTQNESPALGGQGRAGLGNIPEPFRSIARDCLLINPSERCAVDEIRKRLQIPVPVHATEPRRVATPEPQRPAPVEPRPLVPAEPPRPEPSEGDATRLPAFVIPLVLVIVVLAAWGLFHSRGKQSTPPPQQTTQQPQVKAIPKPTPATPQARSATAPPLAKPATKTLPGGGGVLHRVMPDVSQSAKRTIHGTIKVAVWVDVNPAGKVMAAKLQSAGPSRYFAERALRAAEKWEFSPPQVDGQPTTSAWVVQFHFRRNSTEATPQRVAR